MVISVMIVVEHQKIMQKEIQHDRAEIKRPQGFNNPCCVCDCTILIGYCECWTLQSIMIAQHFWARTSLGEHHCLLACFPDLILHANHLVTFVEAAAWKLERKDDTHLSSGGFHWQVTSKSKYNLA